MTTPVPTPDADLRAAACRACEEPRCRLQIPPYCKVRMDMHLEPCRICNAYLAGHDAGYAQAWERLGSESSWRRGFIAWWRGAAGHTIPSGYEGEARESWLAAFRNADDRLYAESPAVTRASTGAEGG